MREYSTVELAERITAAKFFELAPEKLAQLVNGVMVISTPPPILHARLQAFLLTLVGSFVEEDCLGEVLGGNAAVQLSDEQVFVPDVLFVSQARRQIVQAKAITGLPDFVIEILSASTSGYDRGAKRRAYDSHGLGELWLIDPCGPAGTSFYQRKAEHLAEVKPTSGVLRSTAVQGFAARVDWFWPDGDFITVRKALEEITSL